MFSIKGSEQPSSLPTRVLVIRAKNGNTHAFGELYQRFINKIYRFVYFKVSSREIAQDLSHEIFLKAWHHLHSVNEDSFPTWIFTIARNKVIDYYRTKKPLGDLNHDIPDPSSNESILDKLHRQTQADQIKAKIKFLKPASQDIILLRIMQELSVKEVSTILSISPANVRVRTHRAISQLKALYHEG